MKYSIHNIWGMHHHPTQLLFSQAFHIYHLFHEKFVTVPLPNVIIALKYHLLSAWTVYDVSINHENTTVYLLPMSNIDWLFPLNISRLNIPSYSYLETLLEWSEISYKLVCLSWPIHSGTIVEPLHIYMQPLSLWIISHFYENICCQCWCCPSNVLESSPEFGLCILSLTPLPSHFLHNWVSLPNNQTPCLS